MKKVLLCVLVGLLVSSLLLGVATYAAAEGSTAGTFPTRTISVTRSSPGGPRTDTFTVPIAPDRNGFWSVIAESIAGSSVIVEVSRLDAGIPTLESSSKLRFANQESTPTMMVAGLMYQATFTPYGKAGTSVFLEHFNAPYPPVAAFTFAPAAPLAGEAVTFDASTSSDLNNDIVSYAWDFGDASSGSGVTAVHSYASAGIYAVTLTVTDATSFSDTASASIDVAPVPNVPPTADFFATRNLMVVDVDGSASSDSDGTIVDYMWTWGDGSSESSGTSPLASHTYAAPGSYSISLLVTDDDGAAGLATHEVTANTMTEDWTFYDFFNVPYGEWWDVRQFYGLTGDVPIGAECFSNDVWCTPSDPNLPDVASYPYTSWVKTPVDDAMVAAPYRFSADIRQNPAMTVDNPLMLPLCADLAAAAALEGVTIVCLASPPSGGAISINEQIGYLTSARASDLANSGCPDLTFLNDGFMTELRANVTMDGVAAAKLFGVTDPAQWAFGTSDTSLLKSGCGTGLLLDPNSGVVEKGLKAWFEAQGNGPYDIQSAFGAPFSVFSIQAFGSYDAVTGQHLLSLDIVTWGAEALFARWAYWGATTYLAGLGGAAPAGWWGMEQPWTEDLHFDATLGATAFDASASGAIQYHFRASGSQGADATWYTADDVAKWVWQPVLGDRYPPVPNHLASELAAYAGLTYLHTTPGSHRYGTMFAYDYVPAVWQLNAGETQTFRFPTGAVVFYDPFLSGRFDNPRGLVAISAGIVLGSMVPGSGVGTYDALTNTLSVIGPTVIGAYPTTATGRPLESRPIYSLVRG